MTPLLEVLQLEKAFPIYRGFLRRVTTYIQAVRGIDFTIHSGEVVGLVGESGSGKSTAARAAIRLVEPTAGRLTFQGKDLLQFDKRRLRTFRQQVQMVFQDPHSSLNPRKVVGDSIGEALLYHGLVASEGEKRDRVAAILEQVGLEPDVMERYPHQFSGGQQQRLCIGRAIAPNPQLIVCDEAVSALDVSVQAQILNLFSDLKKQLQLSYLFISHDLSVVRYLCDTIVVLYLGQVVESAPAETLFSTPKHPYTQSLLSAIPKSHPLETKKRLAIQGEAPSPISPPSGCPFRTRCPYARPECTTSPPKKSPSPGHTYSCILD